ncbi:hypothetical protein QFC19_007604 [Naganishia cerealis]|uniref:Uncharacterized protein n=1 Tax=Naganishia cerealis TaxID=610337 RepID=A0ACC2V8C4_9TREE|nr:hypothetical protein QFC19_007604 [Naganishia cerealis]
MDPMDTDLPIEPVDDSPVFRASLAGLDAKAYAVRKTCKTALQAAHTVYELLEKLEAAEAELFETLDTLKQQIVKVDAKGKDGHNHTRDETGVVKDLRAWKMNERMEERQQLETLVTSRIKAIQTDLKSKGLGGGGALNTFEEQAKMHYQAVGKHLLPSTNAKYESDRSQARQLVADTDYALSRYTIHSQLLWSAPPYSPPCLDLAICLNMWLSGVLPESPSIDGLAKDLTAEPNVVLRSPDQMRGNIRAEVDTVPGAPFQGTRRRLRTLSQKASMPTLLTTSPSTATLVIQPLKSVATIKEQLCEELELMSRQKQALERAWRERETRQIQLSSISAEAHQQATLIETEQPNSKRQSFQSSRLDSSAKLQAIAEANSPAQSKRMKKSLGMGKRLRGMIQSASFSSNLSLKAFNEPSPGAGSPSAAPRQSMQLDSSSTTSSQIMTRPQPEKRHSFTANSSSRPSSYCSPFLPSPILPSDENGFTSNSELFPTTIPQVLQLQPGSGATHASKQVYRDLQSRSGMQVLEDELHRESAGRKREGMLWTSGIWEDVATSSNKGGDRKERAKWDHCWVVLAGCKLYEYRDALSCKPELDHETIDLQFANARQGRDTDRRFTFEIVTPQYGKRMYQTTSYEDMKRSGSFYQLELDDDMRNAVLLADPIVVSPETTEQQAFTANKGMIPELAPSETMTQERFDDVLSSIPTPSSPADMVLLRKIANQPGNQTCSDCGRPIKGETSQRWATISIHNNPQVLFICIRCAGVHRSFGTHISKVRSPDLDKWTDAAILTARAWGNARGNQIWERNKPPGEKPKDE